MYVVTYSIPSVPPGPNQISLQVLYANTLHAYCTLIIIAYPSVSLAVATLLLAFGKSYTLHIFRSKISPRDSNLRMGR